MANVIYDNGRQSFLDDSHNGGISWDDDIRCILIDTADYTLDAANHDFLDDVPAAARVAVSGSFTGKTSVAGVADADDLTYSAVTGDSVEALIIYKHTGVDATSNLIAYMDTGTGLPVTPNGGDITVTWDSGANRIFKL